jgi:hypothetical protein
VRIKGSGAGAWRRYPADKFLSTFRYSIRATAAPAARQHRFEVGQRRFWSTEIGSNNRNWFR